MTGRCRCCPSGPTSMSWPSVPDSRSGLDPLPTRTFTPTSTTPQMVPGLRGNLPRSGRSSANRTPRRRSRSAPARAARCDRSHPGTPAGMAWQLLYLPLRTASDQPRCRFRHSEVGQGGPAEQTASEPPRLRGDGPSVCRVRRPVDRPSSGRLSGRSDGRLRQLVPEPGVGGRFPELLGGSQQPPAEHGRAQGTGFVPGAPGAGRTARNSGGVGPRHRPVPARPCRTRGRSRSPIRTSSQA